MLSALIQNQSHKERMGPLKNHPKEQVLVHEIYASIQGESTYAGLPCIFVRTTGCHLRCSYCDTEHAFFKGQRMSVESIIAQVKAMAINLVEITGGEPLLQRAIGTLAQKLCDEGFMVLLETSGAVSLKGLDQRVKAIVDVKTPSSKESHRNIYRNLHQLWPGCEVKFVIGDRADYDFSKQIVSKYNLLQNVPVLFSPVAPILNPPILAQWIRDDKLPIRLQMQLHRILWGDKSGV